MKYLRNDSQTENLVEEDLTSDSSEPESVSVIATNCKDILIGVEATYYQDVTLVQEVYPKSCDKKIDIGLPGLTSLCVDGEEQLNKITKDDILTAKHKENGSKCYKWIKTILVLTVLLALLPAVFGAVFLLLERFFPIDINYYPVSNMMPDIDTEYPEDSGLCFIQRTGWMAEPPAEHIRKQILPVERVVISHTATGFCYTKQACKLLVLLTQKFHIKSQVYSDIAYNFLVGGDGCVYVGRGWNFVGSHTKHFNLHGLGISFIGTFTVSEPTERQVRVTLQLIKLGLQLGKISKSYVLNAMCQLRSTVSPGKHLYSIIEKWDHFTVDGEMPPCVFKEDLLNNSTETPTVTTETNNYDNNTNTPISVSNPKESSTFLNVSDEIASEKITTTVLNSVITTDSFTSASTAATVLNSVSQKILSLDNSTVSVPRRILGSFKSAQSASTEILSQYNATVPTGAAVVSSNISAESPNKERESQHNSTVLIGATVLGSVTRGREILSQDNSTVLAPETVFSSFKFAEVSSTEILNKNNATVPTSPAFLGSVMSAESTKRGIENSSLANSSV